MTLFNRLDAIAKRQPQQIALQDTQEAIDWKTMMSKVQQVAEQFRPFKHQVVALYADNSVNWVIVDLAAAMAQVILLPLPTFFSPQQINHSLQESDAVAVITDNQAAIEQITGLQCESVKLLAELQLLKFDVEESKANIPETTSKITFTSGSTGQPKGVCLSVDNQLAVADALLERTGLQSPIHLCVLPLSTLLENIAGIYGPLLSGGMVKLLPAKEMGFNGGKGFDSRQFITAISMSEPNSLILLPELLHALVIAAESGWQVPSSLKFIAVGGSRVSPILLSKAQLLGLPVYEGYGLSECSSVVSLNSFDDNHPGTVGKVLSHVQVQIIDQQVVVSGNAFLGYLNQSESWGCDEVYTGDIGTIDAQGYLHINGRIKNVLISSYGRNISPEWIESEVLSHPMIQQCVVVGDAKPYCSALIQPRDPQITDDLIDGWLTRINQQLPDYAQISKWQRFISPLTVQEGTLTANGRPVREKIYQKYQNQMNDLYEEKTA